MSFDALQIDDDRTGTAARRSSGRPRSSARRSARTRKAILTVHVTSSVGWLGAIASYIAVTAIAMNGADAERVRVCYSVMRDLIWWIVLPMDLASLLSGIAIGRITKWGLVRHYWVAAKLALNVLSTAVLIVYTQEIGYYANEAARHPLKAGDRQTLQSPDSLAHSVGALVIVIAATALAVWKPRGLTRYGQVVAGEPPAQP